MLVACRLAGLSALGGHYAGVNALHNWVRGRHTAIAHLRAFKRLSFPAKRAARKSSILASESKTPQTVAFN